MGFFKGNSDNAIGAGARILIAPSTYAQPTKIGDVIDLTDAVNYPALSTYGFRDIGITQNPITISAHNDVQAWENQQYGRFREVPIRTWGQVSGVDAMELTQQNKIDLMNAFAKVDSATKEHRTNFPILNKIVILHFAAMFMDHNSKIHMIYLPRFQWDGSAINNVIGRGQPSVIPVVGMAYGDDAYIDDSVGGPGTALWRVDFDQYP